MIYQITTVKITDTFTFNPTSSFLRFYPTDAHAILQLCLWVRNIRNNPSSHAWRAGHVNYASIPRPAVGRMQNLSVFWCAKGTGVHRSVRSTRKGRVCGVLPSVTEENGKYVFVLVFICTKELSQRCREYTETLTHLSLGWRGRMTQGW